MSEEAIDATAPPKNDNGVKLPYFHRTLSEEETKILGDITPKRIEPSLNDISSSGRSMSISSAWNQGKMIETIVMNNVNAIACVNS